MQFPGIMELFSFDWRTCNESDKKVTSIHLWAFLPEIYELILDLLALSSNFNGFEEDRKNEGAGLESVLLWMNNLKCMQWLNNLGYL